jgi:DNA-binding NtrC family response regulator
MQEKGNLLYEKLGILQSLDECEAEDAKIFKQKLKVMKEIALVLVEEIEALGYVRSVNISRGIKLHDEMRMFEVHLVQSALERTGGHQTKAAQLLGINLTTLHNKLKRLNISPDNLVDAPVLHEDAINLDEISENHLNRSNDRIISRTSA